MLFSFGCAGWHARAVGAPRSIIGPFSQTTKGLSEKESDPFDRGQTTFGHSLPYFFSIV